jgi:hypothetical protein
MNKHKFSLLKYIVLALFTSSSLAGCYYDIEEEIYPSVGCNLENISFTNTIIPILESNCYQCHDAANNNGGITLEGYSQLKRFVDNGQFLGVVRHEAGFSPMPKNSAKLLDCEIEKIEQWVTDGAPNN